MNGCWDGEKKVFSFVANDFCFICKYNKLDIILITEIAFLKIYTNHVKSL